MSEFELPRNLVRDVEGHDDAGSARCTWLADLPLIVDELAQRWLLDVGRPFQPGGDVSWVAPARNLAGEHLVLKVGWCHDEALHEADGLRVWDGDGAVRLIDVSVFGQTSALLLEACEPGTALSDALPPQEQDAVVASLLSRLWIEPPAGHPFRSLHSMCDQWADEFDETYAATGAHRHRLDPGLARAGMQLSGSCPARPSVRCCCVPIYIQATY